MKLLHVTATHLSPLGGIPVVLKKLSEAQNRIKNFESRVLSIAADVKQMDSPYFYYLESNSFLDFLDDYQPDVIIFHSHYCFEYLKLYRFCIKRKIPYYIEPHGSFGKAALQKSKWKKNVANYIVLRNFMNKAFGFIFLNAREMLDSKFRKANDIVIPNGIDLDFCDETSFEVKKFSFYFIGRFDINHKGLDYLFDALDILEEKKQSLTFDFFGKGSFESEEYLKCRCSEYKSISVNFHGPVYGTEQAKVLNRKGVMVLVSRYEGFPMTVLEAWKCGNPCLVTMGTNVSDEIEKNNVGWVADLDGKSIADALIKAQKEYEEKRELYIARCQDYVLKNYTWMKIADMSYETLKKMQKGMA